MISSDEIGTHRPERCCLILLRSPAVRNRNGFSPAPHPATNLHVLGPKTAKKAVLRQMREREEGVHGAVFRIAVDKADARSSPVAAAFSWRPQPTRYSEPVSSLLRLYFYMPIKPG